MTDTNRPFRVRKKGKTRGRPSKKELILEAILKYKAPEIRKKYDKMMRDLLLYGYLND